MTPNANRPLPRLAMTLLQERFFCVTRAHPVVCRLWRMHAVPAEGAPSDRVPYTYAIGMESPAERYLYCISGGEADARGLFDRIVESRLSPCHLGDIVEDYHWELAHSGETAREFSESSLQTDEDMV